MYNTAVEGGSDDVRSDNFKDELHGQRGVKWHCDICEWCNDKNEMFEI